MNTLYATLLVLGLALFLAAGCYTLHVINAALNADGRQFR
jgi:hypothetical protein